MRIVELEDLVDHHSSSVGQPWDPEGQPDWRFPPSAQSPDDSPYCAPSGSVLLGPSTAGPSAAGGLRFSSRWRDARTVRRAAALARIDDLRSVAPSDAEALLAARNAGAKSAVDELAELLGPDCTLFLRCRNASGSIDQLLLCPQGLLAMTSLYLNATVHCRHDDWRADRFDNFEMFIGQILMTADTGRSPSLRLNAATDVLEEQLYLADLEIGIFRAVLLNHPRSRRGNCRKPTVDIFTSTFDLVTWLRNLPQMLDSDELGQNSRFIIESQRSDP